jgi:hypothetical protein
VLRCHSNHYTSVVFKEVRAKDPERCNTTPDSQFIAVETMLMELLWIFGYPVVVILFVHITRQLEMCSPGADSMLGDANSSRKVGAVFEKWWETSE